MPDPRPVLEFGPIRFSCAPRRASARSARAIPRACIDRRCRAIALTLGVWTSCHPSAPPQQFPERPRGCEVTLYRVGLPEDVKVDSIQEVSTTCSRHSADSDCIRSLLDQVCKLGGDVVYDVPVKPTEESNATVRYSGVAARRKHP